MNGLRGDLGVVCNRPWGVEWAWSFWCQTWSVQCHCDENLISIAYLVERPLNLRKVFYMLGVHLSLKKLWAKMF